MAFIQHTKQNFYCGYPCVFFLLKSRAVPMPARLELSGKKFGWLTVIRPSHVNSSGSLHWDVVCKCGRKKKIQGSGLKDRTSCGCKAHPNLVGQRFRKGVVIKKAGLRDSNQIWLLKCDCGNEYTVSTGRLRGKHTSSCGCLRKRKGKYSKDYKGYKDITLSFWSRVVNNAEKRELPLDITIEYAWDKFIEQDKKCALSGVDIELFDSPAHGRNTASIDRIDSFLGYTKSNIQWVHKHINSMKSNYDQDYFIEVCRAVAKNKQPSGMVSF